MPSQNSASSQNPAKSQELPERESRRSRGDVGPIEPSLWQENHGNVLLAFTAMVCLLGASVLACRQAKFVPPGFPTNLRPATGDDNLSSSLNDPTAADEKLRVVVVRIYGAGSDEGTMRIAMYDKPEGFNEPEKALDTATWRIVDGVCVGKLQMPFEIEKLAIAAYHDSNSDGELNKNGLGIPSERYGYSNNARGITGPPAFDEAVVTIDDQPIDISIR